MGAATWHIGKGSSAADSTPAEQVSGLQALLGAGREQGSPTGVQALAGSGLGAHALSRVDSHSAFSDLFSEKCQQVRSQAVPIAPN